MALWIGEKSRRNLVLRETVGTNEKCVHRRLNQPIPHLNIHNLEPLLKKKTHLEEDRKLLKGPSFKEKSSPCREVNCCGKATELPGGI